MTDFVQYPIKFILNLDFLMLIDNVFNLNQSATFVNSKFNY